MVHPRFVAPIALSLVMGLLAGVEVRADQLLAKRNLVAVTVPDNFRCAKNIQFTAFSPQLRAFQGQKADLVHTVKRALRVVARKNGCNYVASVLIVGVYAGRQVYQGTMAAIDAWQLRDQFTPVSNEQQMEQRNVPIEESKRVELYESDGQVSQSNSPRARLPLVPPPKTVPAIGQQTDPQSSAVPRLRRPAATPPAVALPGSQSSNVTSGSGQTLSAHSVPLISTPKSTATTSATNPGANQTATVTPSVGNTVPYSGTDPFKGFSNVGSNTVAPQNPSAAAKNQLHVRCHGNLNLYEFGQYKRTGTFAFRAKFSRQNRNFHIANVETGPIYKINQTYPIHSDQNDTLTLQAESTHPSLVLTQLRLDLASGKLTGRGEVDGSERRREILGFMGQLGIRLPNVGKTRGFDGFRRVDVDAICERIG